MALDTLTQQSNVSIHAAREGGDVHGGGHEPDHLYVSIHAAREGGDGVDAGQGATDGVSIHAAREGGDFGQRAPVRRGDGFNPRRPRGRRPRQGLIQTIHARVSIHAAREGGDTGLSAAWLVV